MSEASNQDQADGLPRFVIGSEDEDHTGPKDGHMKNEGDLFRGVEEEEEELEEEEEDDSVSKEL